ncbi:MAG: NAD(P)-dependent oxidoreductase, partial [Acetobacterales bacterium]
GRTAGIVGVGNIGSRVAAALHRGFGMKVIGYDPLLTDARWAELSGVVGRRDDLLAMLGEADLVALHCPLDAVTRNMIDREALAAMRPHAILLGASRGGVIDEAALYDALVAGQIAGAGLDVFADEPTPQDHPLLSLDSVVAAPHLGGMSEQGMIAMGVTAVEEVLRVLRGEGPRHRVN